MHGGPYKGQGVQIFREGGGTKSGGSKFVVRKVHILRLRPLPGGLNISKYGLGGKSGGPNLLWPDYASPANPLVEWTG